MTTRTEVLEAAKCRWPGYKFLVGRQHREPTPFYWELRAYDSQDRLHSRLLEYESAPTLDALLAKVNQCATPT